MSVFRCPRCGKGNLYQSALTIAEQCSECGLPFKGREQGDGPAALAILIVGGVVTILATVVEVKYEPSFWLHAVLWVPLVIVGSVLSLRVLKAALVIAQYRTGNDQ